MGRVVVASCCSDRQGHAETVKGMNDAEWFKEMVRGLAAVGFRDTDRKAVFEVLLLPGS